MKINIKYQDILNYVLGFCGYHPLELAIDPLRYSIGDFSIQDTKSNVTHNQSPEYCDFMQKVRVLKLVASDFDSLQVQEMCREIERMGVLEINL